MNQIFVMTGRVFPIFGNVFGGFIVGRSFYVNDFSILKASIEEKSNGLKLGTGGMTSKIKAAKICVQAGIEVCIVNGNRSNFLVDCLQQRVPFTKFTSIEEAR